jgi:hypothetical protein
MRITRSFPSGSGDEMRRLAPHHPGLGQRREIVRIFKNRLRPWRREGEAQAERNHRLEQLGQQPV